MFKRIIIGGFLICNFLSNAQSKYETDFLELWTDFQKYYAYFEKQGIDWDKVKEIYLPLAKDIKSNDEFISFLEQVTHELHNGHISLNTALYSSNRIIPSGQDVFAEKRGNSFFITDVKKNSAAELIGIKPGMQLITFNSKPINEQIKNFLPKYASVYDVSMYSYAVNMLLAGKRDKSREITVLNNGIEQNFVPDDSKNNIASTALLDYRILDGNTGYIRINNSLGDNKLIVEFDRAMEELTNTKSIILDLTDTPSGGNTTVARGIMGRFTDKALPYQKHQINEREFGTVRSWVEYVSPRKSTYKRKLVVMVGHWTGSMGEGVAIGFDGMKRAKIVGTKMAGLLGAIYTFKAQNTNIGYQIPAESMYHINGTPREDFLPQYLTDTETETYSKALKLVK
ncbi:peptidase [Flavobacterium psychrophilum]|nr:peptidase [Flavobacterium psychrophilum]AOE51241.1 peptidase [Flavobacterium psychrophilum]